MLLSLTRNTGMQRIIIHFLENTEQNYPGNFAKVQPINIDIHISRLKQH